MVKEEKEKEEETCLKMAKFLSSRVLEGIRVGILLSDMFYYYTMVS